MRKYLKLRRPLVGEVVGDLRVCPVYLAIWDKALLVLQYDPRRAKRDSLKRQHIRQLMLTLPLGKEYRMGELCRKVARVLKANKVPYRKAKLNEAIWREKGVTIEPVRHGWWRARA